MEEFSQSRYKLEARYQHVLVDEFQDTNRAQWELVALLVRSWGEGFGRPPTPWRRRSSWSATASSRSTASATRRSPCSTKPPISSAGFGPRPVRGRPSPSAFARCPSCWRSSTNCSRRSPRRRTPNAGTRFATRTMIGFRSMPMPEASGCSRTVPVGQVPRGRDRRGDGGTRRGRDRAPPVSGWRRRARSADRHRAAGSRRRHRRAVPLARQPSRLRSRARSARHVPTYVYKGLGFFEADEIQDSIALLRFLADPTSNLRAAAFLRSRIVRLSDRGDRAARAPPRGRARRRRAAGGARAARR